MFGTIDGVYQLTEDPNLNLDEARGAKYIGYDAVGASYYDKDYADSACGRADLLLAEAMAERIGRGLLLDLGCDGGTHAVPVALRGCTVIAGDISQVMLTLLLRKAAANHVPPGRILPCRLNALAIPLADASVDGVLASTMLHLISDHARVLSEMRRVLKPGGSLMLTTNSPGIRNGPAPAAGAAPAADDPNGAYLRLQGAFDGRYWEILNQWGVRASYASWGFDQFAECAAAFGNMTHVHIPFEAPRTWTLEEAFLHRMRGRGYSRQQSVPDDLHRRAFAQVTAEFVDTYGPEFGSVRFAGGYDGLDLHVFTK